jgi:hypothetical protein
MTEGFCSVISAIFFYHHFHFVQVTGVFSIMDLSRPLAGEDAELSQQLILMENLIVFSFL